MTKRTVTSIFMVPTLKIPKDELKSNGFIDGYFKDKRKDLEYKDSVFLLFKPVNLNRFRRFLEEEYERTKSIIEDYDYEDGFVVVVYKLNPEYKKDFDLVREGKYSKTSPAFQNLFPRIVKIIKDGLHRDELALQYRVFNKTPDLIQYWVDKFNMEFDAENYEVWDGFREEDETLDLDKIKEYAKQ